MATRSRRQRLQAWLLVCSLLAAAYVGGVGAKLVGRPAQLQQSGAGSTTRLAEAAPSDAQVVPWPRGGRKPCGTLRVTSETGHCFPASASDHYVCCVDIQNVDNAHNVADPTVARYNPLSGPIRRSSDASSYSWCVCSVSICTDQLNGTVAWVGRRGDT